MSISFELGEPPTRTFYTCDSPIRGIANVSVHSSFVRQLRSIELLFSGRSEVSLRGYPNSPNPGPFPGNGRTMFFEQMTTFATFDAYHPATPGACAFPFDLKFPAVTSIDQTHRELPMSDSVLCKLPSQSGMPLPPTFVQTKNFTTGRAATDIGQEAYRGEIRVIYELEIQLISLHGIILHRGAIQLRFLPQSIMPPPRMTFVRRDRAIDVKSSKLNTQPKGGSFKMWAKGVSAKTPTTAFSLFIDIPNYCTVGSNLAVYMGVDYDFSKSTATDIPPVYLIGFHMTLIEVVRVGTADRMYSTDQQRIITSIPGQQDTHHFHNITGEKKGLPYIKKCNPILITERTDLRNHVTPDSFLVKEQSFETINVSRCFQKCMIDVTVECAGKEIPAHFQCNREIIIRPPDAEPGVVELDHTENSILPPEAPGGIDAQVYEAGGQGVILELQSQQRSELPAGMDAAHAETGWKYGNHHPMHQNRWQNPHENYVELE